MADYTIKNYKGIEVSLQKEELTESTVSSYVSEKLAELAQNATQFHMVDRPAQIGDLVNLAYEGFIRGEAFEGGTAENCDLLLGSGRFIPGFEDQLVGCRKDVSSYVSIQFPDPYFIEDLAGQEAVFHCQIHAVYEPKTPEINDQFAIDRGFESEKELVRFYAEEARQLHADGMDESLEMAVMEVLVDLVEGDLPDAMIEAKLDDMIEDFKGNLGNAGMSLETYMEYTGTTLEAMRDSYRDQAAKSVKLDAALMLIAELESLSVSPAEVDAEYERLMKAYSLTRDDMHEYISDETVADNLLRAKCMELVKANAVINWEE